MSRDRLPYMVAMKDTWTNRLLRALWIFSLVLPTLVALGWTVYPAATAWLATDKLKPLVFTLDELADPGLQVQLKRKLQKHFRDFRIHIPLEDIIFPLRETAHDQRRSLLMQKACGKGKLYVWVPLKFRLPFAGDLIYEWCWIPPVRKT